MTPGEIAAAYPPGYDPVRRCHLVRCPECGAYSSIPEGTEHLFWRTPHVEREYDGYATYHVAISRRYRYALPSGEIVWVWLPEMAT
jgi:hypothetical protein